MKPTNLIIMGALGRMGSTIVDLAQKDQNLKVSALLEQEDKLDQLSPDLFSDPNLLTGSDLENILQRITDQNVIIDFTQPKSSLQHAKLAAKFNQCLVIGTTGFESSQLEELETLAKQARIFWVPNMSVGINVLLQIIPGLVSMLGDKYDLELSEIHHKFKKDAPSGTALKLAQVLAQARQWDEKTFKFCRQGIIGQRPDQEIGIQTLRGGDVIGEHTIYFFGPGERIDITHRAYSRETFAQGALRAAKWIGRQKPGKLYAMADLFA